MPVAGVDGTKSGWVAVIWDGATCNVRSARSAAQLIQLLDSSTLIGIDMPIGLPESAEPGGRDCERLARKVLRAKASSVFSSPVRASLAATTYQEAMRINRASSTHGLGISKQCHALFGKLREIDAMVTPQNQERIFEVHPEVSFAILAEQLGEQTPLPSKKTVAGAISRIRLLEAAGFRSLQSLMERVREFGAAEDDLLDACVSAWTAQRRAAGTAKRLPDDPPRDSRGLAMEIWA